MAVVLDILFPILAGGAVLAGIYFIVRAFRERSKEARAPYSVGKQSAHHALQVDLTRAAFSFIVALILLGVSGFSTGAPADTTPTLTVTATLTTTAVLQTPTALATTLPTFTSVPATATSAPEQPASEPPTPTELPTIEPPPATATITPTPEPQTATVTSGVGVWLRSAPNTESDQLEWLLDGTKVTVLTGNSTAEELEWQEVQTEEGIVGWVAVLFITYDNPSP